MHASSDSPSLVIDQSFHAATAAKIHLAATDIMEVLLNREIAGEELDAIWDLALSMAADRLERGIESMLVAANFHGQN